MDRPPHERIDDIVSKKKASPRQAVAKVASSKLGAAAKVKLAQDAQTTAQGNPVYTGSPAAQSAMQAWQSAATQLSQQQSAVTQLEQQLFTLRNEEPQLFFNYQVAATGYRGVVESLAKGDPKVIAALGLDVKTLSATPTELSPPLGLQLKTTKAGVDWLLWDKVLGARLYVMQVSLDPATDATWTTVQGGGRKRRLSGLVHGQKYLVRVKAMGAKIEGPWSAPLGIVGK